jgi:hypothetical protein
MNNFFNQKSSAMKNLKRILALVSFTCLISVSAFSQPAIQWQKSLGGTDHEEAYSIQQTSDGGFIMAGATHSNDGDVSGYHGGRDFWIVKLEAGGNLLWQKSLGGSNSEAHIPFGKPPMAGLLQRDTPIQTMETCRVIMGRPSEFRIFGS